MGVSLFDRRIISIFAPSKAMKEHGRKKYPSFDEEENTSMVCEPAAECVSALADEMPFEFKYPQGYDGFHTEDADELL
jgi:hypothetical protein